jgi:hypothetical protein
MNDNAKQITPLQLAVAAAVDGYAFVTCADVAARARDQLGYEPSLPSVSRVLGGWGWNRTTIDGKVGYVRPPEVRANFADDVWGRLDRYEKAIAAFMLAAIGAAILAILWRIFR